MYPYIYIYVYSHFGSSHFGSSHFGSRPSGPVRSSNSAFLSLLCTAIGGCGFFAGRAVEQVEITLSTMAAEGAAADGQTAYLLTQMQDMLNAQTRGQAHQIEKVTQTMTGISADIRKVSESMDAKLVEMQASMALRFAQMELVVKESEKRTSDTMAAVEEIKKRMDEIDRQAAASRARSSSVPPPQRDQPPLKRRIMDDSASAVSSNVSGKSDAYRAQPNVLHMFGFPAQLPGGYLMGTVGDLVRTIVPADTKFTVKARNGAKNASVVFDLAEDAKACFEKSKTVTLKWTSPPDADDDENMKPNTEYEVYLKHDQTKEQRAIGQALSVLWRLVAETARNAPGVELRAGELTSDKFRRQIQIKKKYSVVPLFRIEGASDTGFQVAEVSTKSLPPWLSIERMQAIKEEANLELQL